MRRTTLFPLLLPALAIVGCDSELHYAKTDGASGAAGAPVGPAEPATALPPAPIDAPQGDLGLTTVHVIRRFLLPSTEEQMGAYAFAQAVDGLHFTDRSDPTHCLNGGRFGHVVDGPGGADNAFWYGPAWLGYGVNPPIDLLSQTNARVASAHATVAFRVRGVGDLHAYNGLTAEVFLASGKRDAAGAPVPPVDWATYVWAPTPGSTEFPADGSPHARLVYRAAYVVGDELISGVEPGSTSLTIEFGSETEYLDVVIHRPVITLKLSPDRRSGRGIISGIADAKALGASAQRLWRLMLHCASDGLNVGAKASTNVADVMLDGTQRAGVECDGVSVGIGFETVASALSTDVGVDSVLPTDPCP